jgi:hypothetical protein
MNNLLLKQLFNEVLPLILPLDVPKSLIVVSIVKRKISTMLSSNLYECLLLNDMRLLIKAF